VNTIGVVAGSFDPATRGHGWLIEEAARLVDELHIVIGVNPAKKYLFDEAERGQFLEAMLPDLALCGTPVTLHYLRNDLLVQFAARHQVTHIIRGVRNAVDFSYETQMALVNRKIDPAIRTVYMVPPAELSEVASSTVKGLVGFTDWEAIVRDYVHPSVVEAFRRKLAERGAL
jgi:pantetheine-phosphate adenylyltransferase